MSAEEQRAAAAAAQADEISDVDLTPPSPIFAGIDPGGGQPSTDAMTIQQLMSFLAQQSQMMVNMMAVNLTELA